MTLSSLDTAGKGGREVTVTCLHIDLRRTRPVPHVPETDSALLQAAYTDWTDGWRSTKQCVSYYLCRQKSRVSRV